MPGSHLCTHSQEKMMVVLHWSDRTEKFRKDIFCASVLIVHQLVNKSPSLYETQVFITVIIKYRHWTLSYFTLIQSKLSHEVQLRCILILSSHLHVGLQFMFHDWCFFSILLLQLALYMPLTHIPWFWSKSLYFMRSIYKEWNSTLLKFLVILLIPLSYI